MKFSPDRRPLKCLRSYLSIERRNFHCSSFMNPGAAQGEPRHDEVVRRLDHLAIRAVEQIEGWRDARCHVEIGANIHRQTRNQFLKHRECRVLFVPCRQSADAIPNERCQCSLSATLTKNGTYSRAGAARPLAQTAIRELKADGVGEHFEDSQHQLECCLALSKRQQLRRFH